MRTDLLRNKLRWNLRKKRSKKRRLNPNNKRLRKKQRKRRKSPKSILLKILKLIKQLSSRLRPQPQENLKLTPPNSLSRLLKRVKERYWNILTSWKFTTRELSWTVMCLTQVTNEDHQCAFKLVRKVWFVVGMKVLSVSELEVKQHLSVHPHTHTEIVKWEKFRLTQLLSSMLKSSASNHIRQHNRFSNRKHRMMLRLTRPISRWRSPKVEKGTNWKRETQLMFTIEELWLMAPCLTRATTVMSHSPLLLEWIRLLSAGTRASWVYKRVPRLT